MENALRECLLWSSGLFPGRSLRCGTGVREGVSFPVQFLKPFQVQELLAHPWWCSFGVLLPQGSGQGLLQAVRAEHRAAAAARLHCSM